MNGFTINRKSHVAILLFYLNVELITPLNSQVNKKIHWKQPYFGQLQDPDAIADVNMNSNNAHENLTTHNTLSAHTNINTTETNNTMEDKNYTANIDELPIHYISDSSIGIASNAIIDDEYEVMYKTMDVENGRKNNDEIFINHKSDSSNDIASNPMINIEQEILDKIVRENTSATKSTSVTPVSTTKDLSKWWSEYYHTLDSKYLWYKTTR